jgi:hypothetical protein
MNMTFEAMLRGDPARDLDEKDLDAKDARLPDKPDETLRWGRLACRNHFPAQRGLWADPLPFHCGSIAK